MSRSSRPLDYSNGSGSNNLPSAPSPVNHASALPPIYAPQSEFYDYAPAAPSSSHPAPSAPFLGPNNRGLEHFSYDQVVTWWNALSEDQRQNMQAQGKKISVDKMAALRNDYKKYYPKDYYPKEIYSRDQLSACDYYLMYYLCEEMAAQYDWFNEELLKAFEVPPPPYDDLPKPPSYAEATAWWNGLNPEQQQNFQNRRFEPAQVILIQREYRPYYRAYYADRVYGPNLDFYDFYLMSRYPSRLYGYPIWAADDYLLFQSMRTSFELTRLAVHGGYHAARFMGNALGAGLRATGGFLGSVGNNALGHSDKDGKGALAIMVGIAVIVGTIVAATSAVVGSIYSGIKASASAANLAQGKKWARSLLRLASMGAGAYVGATQGAVIGAMVGSLVPGIGTAAGAIIGAIFGAPITAALAGALVKYSVQLVSWVRTGSTNPEKWDAEKANQEMYKNKGRFSMTTAEIREVFTHLREQKNQFKTVKGAVAGTSDNTEKNRFNKFLDAIKSGLDPRDGIRVDAHTRFKWDSEKHAIERRDVDLPKLESGLKL